MTISGKEITKDFDEKQNNLYYRNPLSIHENYRIGEFENEK